MRHATLHKNRHHPAEMPALGVVLNLKNWSRRHNWIVLLVFLAFIGVFILWPHANVAQEVQRDTHGKVRVVRIENRHGVSIVQLSTPRGPEIGYLIHHRYLALGPLMDLKSGRNMTPIWSGEKNAP